jgi:hypothetical protein
MEYSFVFDVVLETRFYRISFEDASRSCGFEDNMRERPTCNEVNH